MDFDYLQALKVTNYLWPGQPFGKCQVSAASQTLVRNTHARKLRPGANDTNVMLVNITNACVIWNVGFRQVQSTYQRGPRSFGLFTMAGAVRTAGTIKFGT
jgi:hypothetical protein